MVDLSILIELWDSHESEAECAELMRDLSCAVLPVGVADPHASLTSLHYKITYDAKDEFTLLRTRLGTFPKIFTIPLDKIPTVSTLTITARTRTLFTREAQAGVVGSSEKCGLQEVHFVGCDYMEIEDFRSSIQSLKDIEVWESIERIVVEYCDSLEYDEALEVVGIQRLRMPRLHWRATVKFASPSGVESIRHFDKTITIHRFHRHQNTRFQSLKEMRSS